MQTYLGNSNRADSRNDISKLLADEMSHTTPKRIWIKSLVQCTRPSYPLCRSYRGSKKPEIKILHGQKKLAKFFVFPTEIRTRDLWIRRRRLYHYAMKIEELRAKNYASTTPLKFSNEGLWLQHHMFDIYEYYCRES